MALPEYEVDLQNTIVKCQSGISVRMQPLFLDTGYDTFNAGVISVRDNILLFPRAAKSSDIESDSKTTDRTIVQTILLPRGNPLEARLIQPNIHFPQPDIIRSSEANRGRIGVVQYEDFRVEAGSDFPRPKSEVIAGATSVIEGDIDIANWCACIIEGTVSEEGMEARRVRIFPDLPGKNLTPAGRTEKGNQRFLFRDERKARWEVVGTRDNHILDVLEDDGEQLTQTHELIFPKLPWAKDQIGTQGPPRQLADGRWFVPIHGYTVMQSETPTSYGGIFQYAKGIAIVSEDWKHVLKTSKRPSFTRSDYYSVVGPDQELHNFRRVIYCVGDDLTQYENSPDDDELSSFDNVGDKLTVMTTARVADLMELMGEPRDTKFLSQVKKPRLRLVS